MTRRAGATGGLKFAAKHAKVRPFGAPLRWLYMNKNIAALLGCLLLVPAQVLGALVFVPAGTVVYGELEEKITSSARKFRVGFEPLGHVWRDVTLNGVTIIEAGTPLELRISRLDPRGIGGRGGEVEISAVSVESVAGEKIMLRGGYGQDPGDRTVLTQALSAIVWPTAFLPGRRAVLEEGMVFDTHIPADTYVEVPDDAVPTVNLHQPSGLTVIVKYDELNRRADVLPLEISLCGMAWNRNIEVTHVNDREVKPILVTVLGRRNIDSCYIAEARINLEALSGHFDKGINRFSVSVNGVTEDVVLNVEM
jgi:hypothetical protein